ncbi:type II/IV secretion system ATPase subunit [Candidatus Micrarchaeota archaeon]|nr:type II/IV secretion system ATPase subunit [Candidatus Micrarchaeota archaeon]
MGEKSRESVLEKYTVIADGVPAEVVISRREGEFVDSYEISTVKFQKPTQAVIDHIRQKILEDVNLKASEVLDAESMDTLHHRFVLKAGELVNKEMFNVTPTTRSIIVGKLAHELLGLGDLELFLADDKLEEIVVNSCKEPVWVYHKKHGWLKTDYVIPSEESIHNFASIIGRKSGRQVSTLYPLLDAHLVQGDRANATLYPISAKGSCIVIRKFARNPWTIASLIPPVGNTLSVEVAALLWLCIQYELNIVVAGGTASGKTSMLNALMMFCPPNQRIISIEDTREIYLPDFLHWTPLVTRSSNTEGKGEVTMLDLMVNSLRMRPDRIVVGEIRRQREAEVLFEAMHTGHSVYSTIHADNAEQVKNRMITPPISLPETQLSAVHLVLVQYRQRRTGLRRVLEVAEFVPQGAGVSLNRLYQWNARKDALEKVGEFKRIIDELALYSGMSPKEIAHDLEEKEAVLEWVAENKISGVNGVGTVIASYYREKEKLMNVVKNKGKPEEIISAREAGEEKNVGDAGVKI